MSDTQDTVIVAQGQDSQDGGAWRILEGVSYLGQCLANRRSFAILTGHSSDERRLVLQQFLGSLPDSARVAEVAAPTDSCYAFLETILGQFGFDSFESSADELQRLLTVVLRQGGSRPEPTVIVMDEVQQFGPRVLEAMREIAQAVHETPAPPLFVLGGARTLWRILESRGMSSIAPMTRLRFDLDVDGPVRSVRPDVPVSVQSVGSHPALVLSHDSTVLGAYRIVDERMLIGRGQHCDITISSRFVSRQHALLLRKPDGDWLVDLKSTNGTSVNSQLIGQRRLEHGDVISIGGHQLRYHNPEGAWPAAAPQSRPDALAETMVMRSMRAALDDRPSASSGGSDATSAA